MKATTRNMLLLVSIVAGLMLLEVLLPPRTTYYKAKAIVRWMTISAGLGSAIVGHFIAQRRITWNRELPSWNVAALQAPFGAMNAQVASALARLPAIETAGITYHPCCARLESGSIVARCVLLDAAAFERLWPGRPPVLPAVRIEHVVDVAPSSATLDARHIARMEAATAHLPSPGGRFRFLFDNGNDAVVEVGPFAAIPELPIGRAASQVLDVLPARETDGPVHETVPPTLCVFSRAGRSG